jgi:excisionase family DNA binding protein
MLVSVKDAAAKMNVSERTIQNKAKKQRLPKIGNQYQITEAILQEWLQEQPNEKPNETKPNEKKAQISQKPPKHFFAVLYTSIIILVLLLSSSIAFNYLELKEQINDFKTRLQTTEQEHKETKESLTKRLNDAHDIIHIQELEIQYLKIKDSIKETKNKW